MIDLVVCNALVLEAGRLLRCDIAIENGYIVGVEAQIEADAPVLDAEGCLVVPGLVETHIHLDKACILDRCAIHGGTVEEALRETSKAKSAFTIEDVYARGARAIETCITQGTTRMRTHVELDPGIGLIGLEAVERLARDYRWAIDLEICVFPQEGLTNNPGTEELLIQGLKRGARAIGAVPYVDTNPRGQIDRIFALAREHDAEIDMHLDIGDGLDGMNIEYVCAKTAEYGWGGRIAVGHMTKLSLLSPAALDAMARRMAECGIAVTILPSTDLYLTGRTHDRAIPRGVVSAEPLRAAGVNCTVSTNNILNPFTPYGDGSLIRMANLYANVCHVAAPEALTACLDMVTTAPARLLNLDDYGIAPGCSADLVALDAFTPDAAIAALAQPLWGLKRGRRSFTRDRPRLHAPLT